MKKLFVAAVAAGALAAVARPASAADIAVAPIYRPAPVVIFSWTGIYIGAHLGGGWARKEESALPFRNAGSTISLAPTSFDLGGWLGGGQVGANYQSGSWVLGIEAQASWARLTGSSACSSTVALAGATTVFAADCSAKVYNLGTIAGRLGFALDHLLIYGKAGAAWTDDKYNIVTPTAGLPLVFGANETRWGWMLGAGLEYAFTDAWSAKVEYNYMNFGSRGIRFSDTTGLVFVDTSISQHSSVVKIGINYRLGVSPIAIRY